MDGHDLLDVTDDPRMELGAEGGIGEGQPGEVERRDASEQAGRDEQLHRDQPWLAEQLEADDAPHRLADPRRLDRCRNRQHPQRDEEHQDQECHEQRLHELAEQHEEHDVGALPPPEAPRWLGMLQSRRERLCRRAVQERNDRCPGPTRLDRRDLGPRAGHDEDRRDEEQEREDRRQVRAAERVGRLPQLRCEEQEDDEDQEHRHGAGHQGRDLGELSAEVLDGPDAELEQPERGEQVDDPDAEQDRSTDPDDHRRRPVEDRGRHCRHQPDRRDVDRVEAHAGPERRAAACPEVDRQHDKARGDDERHAERVLGQRQRRASSP